MEYSGPEVNDLFASFGSEGDFEYLLDFGNLRYHLLLEFNLVEPECAENTPLSQLYDAVSWDDQDAVQTCIDDCLGVIWPFLRSDYASREGMTATHVIKLQATRTTNGVLHVETHDHHLEYPPTKAIDNHFSGVVTYKPCEVERLEEIKMHIFRVRLHDNIYCMKTVHRTGRETDFIREVMTLQQCSHPNILRLVRLVEAEGSEKIEGMLTEYISKGRVLRDIDVLSVDEFKRWTQQIQEAVAYIHEKGLVWGDAKAANVLIDDIGNAILIDFSGGFTKGWVDEVNHDTPRGDIQGQEKIIDFMKERRPQ